MRLAAFLADLAQRDGALALPARVRVVVEAALAGAVAEAGLDPEWCGTDAAETLAAAAGVMAAEGPRGGMVVALLRGGHGLVGALGVAASIAGMDFRPTIAVAGAAGVCGEAFAALGWRAGSPHGGAAFVQLGPEADHPLAPVRREWAPVRLRALDEAAAARDPSTFLAALHAREPRLVLAQAQTPWSALPTAPATLVALAALASEGRRVVWRLPPGTDLAAWWPSLRAIGLRGIACTLLCAADDLPPVGWWRTLPAWWVASPADAGETVAVLARALASEDAVCIALPPEADLVPAWPAGEAHEPGAGRWLARVASPAATIVCAGADAPAVLRAQEALAAIPLAVDVLCCTSLRPLPEADLQAAAERGPLVVAAAGDEAGLAAAVAAAVPGVRLAAAGRVDADIAAAVREIVGA